MALYLDDRFPMETPKTVDLPSDLMCTPIQGNHGVSICHSDSTGKWYAIHNFEHSILVDGEQIFAGYLAAGTWLDIARYYFDPYWMTVPFHWGEVYLNKTYPDRLQYIPVWQSVPSGKYDDDGLPKMMEDYKIIVIMPYALTIPADNPVQYNMGTRCEVKEYGQDLLRLVEDLQMYTETKF